MDKLRFSMVMLAAGMLCAGDVWSAQAGRVQFVNGNVEVTNAAGIKHTTQKGDAINEGDTLTSAKTASAQIKMQDGGFIAVRPDSKIKFDSFKFSGKPGEVENSTFSLFRGGFRAITGLIGRLRHQDYRINTPAATIGIRGTDHETVLVLADNPLVKAGLVEAGAYNKVNVGETSITTNRGTVNVLPNQMGFAGGLDLAPQIKPINTSLFTVVPQTTPGAKMDSGKSGDSGSRSTASVNTPTQAATENAAPANAAPGDSGLRSTASEDTQVKAATDYALPPAAGSPANAATPPVVTPPTVVVNLAGTDSPIPTTPPVTAPPVTTPPVTTPPVTTPPVTAAYVNPNIMFSLSSSTAGAVLNQSVGTGAPTAVSPATNPTSFVYNYGNGNNCTTCTTSISYLESLGTAGTTTSDATTGAQWGYWIGASLTTTTTVGTTSTPLPTVSAGNVSWITAPAANPFYLPSVLTGSANYNLVGGVATDGTTVTQLSSAGNSATLSVNFTNQTANLLMTVVTGATAPVTWQVTGSSAPLTGIGQGAGQSTFNFTSGTCATGSACGALTFTSAGITASSTSTASGSLDGNGLTGAIVNFYLNGTNANGPTSLSGVAALGLSPTTPINAATPWVATLASFSPAIVTTSTSTTPLIWNGVNGNAVNTAPTTIDAAGNLSVWQTNNGNNSSLGLPTAGAQTVSFTGATAMDAGSDPVSGIKWGRWAGGSIIYTPVAGGTAATIPGNVDYHWILTPSSNGPIALPVSGTYNYVYAGGTLPTDQLGNTGVVNSASLSANFSLATVNLGINVTVPTSAVTFNASASNVPIQNGTYFEVGNNSGATGTITCTGTCGATTSGAAVGVFTQAGTGAAVSYGFQTGATATPGSPTTMVNGVLAFHR